MKFPSIDEARNTSAKYYAINVKEWHRILTERIANQISVAMQNGSYKCIVDFTCYIQDKAFETALDEICHDLGERGYEITYTHSGTEYNTTCDCICVSWELRF